MIKIAVIMSVYKNDDPIFLDAAINSVLNQTFKSFDIYLQVDGQVPIQLSNKLNNYQNNYQNIYIEFINENKGLAWQLNRAISRLSTSNIYSFIARMDADDICEPERFQKQIEYFHNHPDVAICGTQVIEFHEDGYTQLKKIPCSHAILSRYIIKRCPFNHPTVMFNLSNININHIHYNPALMNTQDYYLWVDLLEKKYIFGNLDEPLLRFRVDKNFYNRRGFKKAKNDFNARLYAMKKLDLFSPLNFIFLLLIVSLRLSPPFLKKFAYKYLR
ncbi:glycosyltransferase [Providencia rettgeri]|uniref:glycosyltransferase n=1 Tax=Providencia rettgeri TaxID=587 RepID=UPI0008FB2261|nr:glycosyltransferase [Providencia rettgeri]